MEGDAGRGKGAGIVEDIGAHPGGAQRRDKGEKWGNVCCTVVTAITRVLCTWRKPSRSQRQCSNSIQSAPVVRIEPWSLAL